MRDSVGGAPIFVSWSFPARLRRLGRRLLIVLSVLAAVHSLAALFLGRQLDARLNALRHLGESVSLVELAGSVPPDSDNAALIYARVFRILERPEAKKDG